MEAISNVPPLKQRVIPSSLIEAEITSIDRPHCSIFPSGTRSKRNNNADNDKLGDGNYDENSNTTGDAGTVENEDNRYYCYFSTNNNHTVEHNPLHYDYSEPI